MGGTRNNHDRNINNRKNMIRNAILIALAYAFAQNAHAFCGFYVAKADATSGPAALPEMVNPLTGKAMAAEPARGGKSKPTTDATLSDRLNKVDRREVRDQ